MDESVSVPYEVKLEVFEGPLDLLLHLIKKNEINIYDIPIALITGQYLEYLQLMKSLNLTIAGEFLVMAATLIHIKSRTLLPPAEIEEEEPEEDPRADLVRRLIEYKQFKEAAEHLGRREEGWKDVYWREPLPLEVGKDEPPALEVSLFDLLGAFREMLERAPSSPGMAITIEELTVKDKMNFIIERIENEPSVSLVSIFQVDRTRLAMVVTFLALLELVRLGFLRAVQIEPFGPIRLLRREEIKNGGSGTFTDS